MFQNILITAAGRAKLAQATASDPIQWTRMLAITEDHSDDLADLTLSDFTGAVQASAINASSLVDNGEPQARVTGTFTSGGTTVKTIGLMCFLSSESPTNSVLAVVCADPVGITLPTSGSGSSVFATIAIGFPSSVAVASVAASPTQYALLSDLSSYMTIHDPSDHSQGAALENVLGDKRFVNDVTFMQTVSVARLEGRADAEPDITFAPVITPGQGQQTGSQVIIGAYDTSASAVEASIKVSSATSSGQNIIVKGDLMCSDDANFAGSVTFDKSGTTQKLSIIDGDISGVEVFECQSATVAGAAVETAATIAPTNNVSMTNFNIGIGAIVFAAFTGMTSGRIEPGMVLTATATSALTAGFYSDGRVAQGTEYLPAGTYRTLSVGMAGSSTKYVLVVRIS